MKAELFIGGVWRSGRGSAFASIDPATGARVWEGAGASADDVGDAMKAARGAFVPWARRPLEERVAVARAYAKALEASGAALAECICRETGKTLWEAKAEVASMVGKVEISIRAQAERAGAKEEAAAFGKLALAHRPLGVLSVFGPFNFPGHLPNGHIVPALLAGNTIVFKPSELVPGVASIMVEAWEQAGLPAGVLNLVQGGRDAGAALLGAEGLAGVLFTGSATTGTYIHKLFAGRPDVMLALEMGGNNPLIVWPGVDVGVAANLIAHSSFVTTGQRCSCARRLILPDDKFGADVVEAVAALAKEIKAGPWTQSPEPFMGPLVSVRAAEHAAAAEAELIAKSGKAIASLSREGAFVRPGIVDMTGVDTPDEEVFAPLVQVFRVRSFDEALAKANDTRFGLAGGLVSDDGALWERARIEMRAGILNWNRPTTGASGALPFGGPGLSGSLRPSAYYAADYVAYPAATQAAEKPVAISSPGLP